MQKVTKTFTIEIPYQQFEPGEKVQIVRQEDEGVFEVLYCYPPLAAEDDDSWVELKGKKTLIPGWKLKLAEEEH